MNKEKVLNIKFHDPFGVTSPKNDVAERRLKEF